MMRLKLIAIAWILSLPLVAEEPESKAGQCALYGAYQDPEGNWQTCLEEDMPSYDYDDQ